MKKLCLSVNITFLITFLLLGCNNQSQQDQNERGVTEIKIDTLYTFTDFETHNIAQPSSIRILSNGLIAVVDYATQIITLVNSEGKLISTFGRQGRGPGEFLNIRNVLEIDNRILVHDSHQNTISFFSSDGELVENHSLSSFSMNKNTAFISDSIYVIGTKGFNQNLLQTQFIDSDSVLNFGELKVPGQKHVDMVKSQNQLKSGKLPDLFKNKVVIRTDENYIYVFFEALSELQKYDVNGNLIWHHHINLPHNEKIFENVIENTKKHTSSRSIPSVKYIFDFEIFEDGIFILTSRPLNQSQLLVKLNKQGEITTTYQFPEDHEFVYNFDINPRTNTAYFTSWSAGFVYKTILPE